MHCIYDVKSIQLVISDVKRNVLKSDVKQKCANGFDQAINHFCPKMCKFPDLFIACNPKPTVEEKKMEINTTSFVWQ